MKQALLVILLLLPAPTFAQDKFWISNKVEVGYGNIFLSEHVHFEKNEFIKSNTAMGLKLKLSDSIKCKIFYLLENAQNNKWKKNHFLGMSLNLKLQ